MTSEDDERCWQELIKDVRRLPHDKPPLSGRKTELRVVPKISPDRVYRGAALADIVIGGTDTSTPTPPAVSNAANLRPKRSLTFTAIPKTRLLTPSFRLSNGRT